MQQPDYRDQSETEVKGQTEESIQSDTSETQKQKISRLEQGEKEADVALVSESLKSRHSHRHKHRHKRAA